MGTREWLCPPRPAGGVKTNRATLGNRGRASLTLTAIRGSDVQFVSQAGFSNLESGQSGSVDVRREAQVPGLIHGSLTLTFEAPEARMPVLSLAGTWGPKAD